MPPLKELSGLYKAAREGDLPMVMSLLRSGVDVNQIDRNGLSALYRAASKGHVEVIRILLDAGAKLDVGIRSPLFMAMQTGQPEAVTLLYRAAGGDRRLLSGRIIHGWSMWRLFPKWHIYSQKQARPPGGSCMHFAATHNLVSMVSFLRHLGEDVDCIHSGLTALHVAAALGGEHVLHELLTHGADPNKSTGEQCTALHYAVYHGKSLFVIQTLLEHGANPNARDKAGNGSLHIMSFRREYLEDKKMFPLLLQHGADVNLQNRYGRPPLYYANMPDMARRLIANGADVNLRDFVKQETPLHRLSRRVSSETVKLLLDSGAKVNARNIYYRTSLHLSGLREKIDTMEILLDARADVNIQDIEHGETPCHIIFSRFNQHDALGRKHHDILRKLFPEINAIQGTSCFGTTMLDTILCGSNKDFLPYAKDLMLMNGHRVLLNKPLYWMLPRYTVERYSLHTTASVIVTRFSLSDIEDIFHSLSPEKKAEFLQARNFLHQNSLHILLVCGDCPEEEVTKKIDLLVRLGVDALKADINGRHLLHLALLHKRYKCGKLLQSGRPHNDSMLQDNAGRTAMQYEQLVTQEIICHLCAQASENEPGGQNVKLMCTTHTLVSALTDFCSTRKYHKVLTTLQNSRECPENIIQTMVITPGFGFVASSGENLKIQEAVDDLLETLVVIANKLDPRFQCTLRRSGSSNPAEATKVGWLDEMDYICMLDVFARECVVSYDSKHDRPFAVIHNRKGQMGVFSEFWIPSGNFPDIFAYERFIARFWCLIMEALHMADTIKRYPLTVENCVRRNGFVGTFHLIWHGKTMPHHRLTVDLVPAIKDQEWILLLSPRYFDNKVVGDKPHTSSLELSSEIKDRNLFVSLPSHVKDGYRVAKMLLNLFTEQEFVVDSKKIKAKDTVPSFILKASLFWLLDPERKFGTIYGPGAAGDSHNPRNSLQKDAQTFHWGLQLPNINRGLPTTNQKHREAEIIYCRPCFHAISQEMHEEQSPQKLQAHRPSQMTEWDARPARFWALRIYQMLRYILQLENSSGKPRDIVNYLLPFQPVRVRDRQLVIEICDVFESILTIHNNM